MKRRALLFGICLLTAGLWGVPRAPVYADDMPIVILALHNRSASEVIPLLRPFLVPGGAITGTGYKLIVKTTPENLADIKKLLANIDAGLHELIISVRQGATSTHAQRGVSVNADVNVGGQGRVTAGGDGIGPYAGHGEASVQAGGDGSQVSGQVYGNQSSDQAPEVQRIRVLEGQWANITTGMQFPVVQRQRNPDGSITATVVYKDVTSGFQVLPRVHGNRVTLNIRPSSASLSSQGGGVINMQQAETTVSGNLGQWIEIGGISQSSSSQSGGLTYRSQDRSEQASTISVKVDLAH